MTSCLRCNALHFSLKELSQDDLSFYETNVQQSAKDPVAIFRETQGQSANSKWFFHRKFRVTASVARKIAKGRRKESRIKYFLENIQPTKSMAYGLKMEPAAREQFKILFNKNVLSCGLVVNPSIPWLGASPDGIIQEEDGSVSILEIKCPSSCEDDQISVDYIVNGSLKKSHTYYTQVQVTMLLCHAKVCHFFVFSMADHVHLEVEFDEDFV